VHPRKLLPVKSELRSGGPAGGDKNGKEETEVDDTPQTRSLHTRKQADKPEATFRQRSKKQEKHLLTWWHTGVGAAKAAKVVADGHEQDSLGHERDQEAQATMGLTSPEGKRSLPEGFTFQVFLQTRVGESDREE
jgi:hypothetical protein